jgi:hypothetical protein
VGRQLGGATEAHIDEYGLVPVLADAVRKELVLWAALVEGSQDSDSGHGTFRLAGKLPDGSRRRLVDCRIRKATDRPDEVGVFIAASHLTGDLDNGVGA